MSRQKIKVLHIITSLAVGGAERMLHKLSSSLHGEDFEFAVFSLSGGGPIADRLRELGIQVKSFNLRGVKGLFELYCLVRAARRFNPDIVHSWMVHANFLAYFLCKFILRRPLLWGIRCSELKKPSTRFLTKFCSYLSHFPKKIIYNSFAGQQYHESLGYCSGQAILLPNGISCDQFAPNEVVKPVVRQELKLTEEDLVVGTFARYHPMKDYPTLIRVISKVVSAESRVKFLLAGRGVSCDNAELTQCIEAYGVKKYVCLLGERSDINRLLCALDVFCLPSAYGEGWPNAIGEAMSTAVPCVATDVGDSASIIGSANYIAKAGDAEGLAAVLIKLLKLSRDERQHLGQQGRERILKNYSLDQISKQYQDIYLEFSSGVKRR